MLSDMLASILHDKHILYRKRGSPASDQTGENDSSASEPKSESESEMDSSEAELDESEDEGVIPKRRRKDHGLPKRTLPKRNTAARPSLKEPSESENGELLTA